MAGNARTGFSQIGGWRRYFHERDDTILVLTANDIERAKKEEKLGLILHCLETALVEDELDLIESYQAAGLRIVQLCYNRKNLIEDGAGERTDAGLSHFGIKFIERLNASTRRRLCTYGPSDKHGRGHNICVARHYLAYQCYGVQDNGRKIQDELICAIAENGGVVGTVGFPPFLSWEGQATLDQFIDDIAYKADRSRRDRYRLLPRPASVEDDETAMKRYDGLVRNGHWRPEEYLPPHYKFPQGIETPRTLQNLTARLLERGFSELDMRKIWGLNWMRVYHEFGAGKICGRYVTVVTANHRIPGQIEHILER